MEGVSDTDTGVCVVLMSAITDPFEKRMDALSRKKSPQDPAHKLRSHPHPLRSTPGGWGGSGSPAQKNFTNTATILPFSPEQEKVQEMQNGLGEAKEATGNVRSSGAAGSSATAPPCPKCPRPPPMLPPTKPRPRRADELPARRAGQLPASDLSLPPTHPQLWERMLDRQNLHLTSMNICHEFQILFALRNCN